mmetsp:Transcript_58711/g.132880  ORF Transcript_58711/g.132880 Transcript_58711/m.132880 type:complete len:364 (+) Transcript_58711:59-1150(+)
MLKLLVLSLPATLGFSPTFVLTGGPCSGKSSAISELPKTLLGHEVVRVPEAATLYFSRGGRFPFSAPQDASGLFSPLQRNLLWESWLIELKMSLENHARSQAARVASKSVIICDRGTLDSRAYLSSDEEWADLLKLGGWSEAELLGRYHGVVCLEVAPEQYYTNENNEARHESYSEALDVHARTWDAWARSAERVRSTQSRRDFRAEFLPAASPPLPVLVANPEPQDAAGGAKGAAFSAKVDRLQACLEGMIAQYEEAGAEARSNHGRALSEPAALTLPVSAIIAQADAIASRPDLTVLGPASVKLLKEIQRARRHEAEQGVATSQRLPGIRIGTRMKSKRHSKKGARSYSPFLARPQPHSKS